MPGIVALRYDPGLLVCSNASKRHFLCSTVRARARVGQAAGCRNLKSYDRVRSGVKR